MNDGATLRAGVARRDITDYASGPVNDPLYAKALVVADGETTVVIVTVDAVAVAAIGSIRDDYLATVRARLHDELQLNPDHLVVNASHCHGRVGEDVAERTVAAVAEAAGSLIPVRVGVGRGHEDRIQENRRLRLHDGGEADVRHAYSLVADDAVVGTGPVDPEIGVLRLDRLDGTTLAVIYNFACHPIQGVPSGANTADLSGFASQAIEDGLGHGATALFLQGCAGDVNPVLYKDVDHPRDGEPLGQRLGLSALRALGEVETRDGAALRVERDVIELPRADLRPAIAALRAEQDRLVQSLHGTTLNLKAYLQLAARYGLAPDHPSAPSHRYLRQQELGRTDLGRLDQENRRQMARYAANVLIMEQLTRLRANLDLLVMHQRQNEAAGSPSIGAEVVGLRVGEFVLLTFPGELSTQIGLNVKGASPHPFTFVAGCTNGYLYYAPTAAQLANRGGAQEDSDCLLAPEWQALFEGRAQALLERL